ncbi:hypothetical protein Cgig2_029868 [Carnegiea gigantea]|uniref:Uncharacterized protein n=1 Tax=Carnegiea gigantea TaxID=171969 RepID=A0A9Q1K591_9CARY|nr:hypothetical protein Cgig2_029868 [Carnegiea gigantea]
MEILHLMDRNEPKTDRDRTDRTGPRPFGPVLGPVLDPVLFQFRSSVQSGPGPGEPAFRLDRTELELVFFSISASLSRSLPLALTLCSPLLSSRLRSEVFAWSLLLRLLLSVFGCPQLFALCRQPALVAGSLSLSSALNSQQLALSGLSSLALCLSLALSPALLVVGCLSLSVLGFSKETLESLGHTVTSLKSFSLTELESLLDRCHFVACDEGALAIAKSMSQLRRLQLMGNTMTNEGLRAILHGCPLLEALDLCACFHIDLSGDLGERCRAIKQFRFH